MRIKQLVYAVFLTGCLENPAPVVDGAVADNNVTYDAGLPDAPTAEDGGLPDAPAMCMMPSVRDATVSPYAVSGTTCTEAQESIFGEGGNGPIVDGERRGGQCECSLFAPYGMAFAIDDTHARKICCTASIDEVMNGTTATVQLPEWSGCDPCYTRFYEGLVAHEQGR